VIMNNGRRLTIALAVLAVVFPAVLYVVAYFAMVERGTGWGSLSHTTWHPSYTGDFEPSGRLRIFFQPLHHVDRTWVRPDYWEQDNYKQLRIPLHNLPSP